MAHRQAICSGKIISDPFILLLVYCVVSRCQLYYNQQSFTHFSVLFNGQMLFNIYYSVVISVTTLYVGLFVVVHGFINLNREGKMGIVRPLILKATKHIVGSVNWYI